VLAVELSPVRVNALSPGFVDPGASDALGTDNKDALFAKTAAKVPARRAGQMHDISSASADGTDQPIPDGLNIDRGGRLT
jgi:NAD(P)-dependent dehydrogenase (short-subunit alcohol dehydrogenase family)